MSSIDPVLQLGFLLGLVWAVILAYQSWFDRRYMTEEHFIEDGWARLQKLNSLEPERLWTVHHVDEATQTMILRGLRHPRE